MDIAAWLASLGLAQYAAAFAKNDITEALLPKLTGEDLKDLGVTSIGHRRLLLDAIATLTAAPGVAVAPPATPEPQAERRQLTVMFCDLVGSTALSARLDAEDLRAVIGAYHRCAAAVIERAGGFVAKYMGDGVLAYFGYPRADEHDAERAVRAGLALVAAVPRLDTAAETRLQVRVGIATGIVVVGDLLGQGAAQEQAVVGETPNLAARLQAMADPGSVVIAPSTRRLTGGLFDYEDLGAIEIKGLAAAVAAARVLRESAAESRFEALRASATPLVGRDEELAMLERRLQQAKCGEGGVVLLSGEPGIGKSRLAQTLIERLAGEAHTRLRTFCSPHHQDQALYPTITQLERAALEEGREGSRRGFSLRAEAFAKGNRRREVTRSAHPRRDFAITAALHREYTPPAEPARSRRKSLQAFAASIRRGAGSRRRIGRKSGPRGRPLGREPAAGARGRRDRRPVGEIAARRGSRKGVRGAGVRGPRAEMQRVEEIAARDPRPAKRRQAKTNNRLVGAAGRAEGRGSRAAGVRGPGRGGRSGARWRAEAAAGTSGRARLCLDGPQRAQPGDRNAPGRCRCLGAAIGAAGEPR